MSRAVVMEEEQLRLHFTLLQNVQHMFTSASAAGAHEPDQARQAAAPELQAASKAEEEEQGADLQQLLQLYKEEREQLSKDVLFYKHSCKDLKRRLRAEVGVLVLCT